MDKQVDMQAFVGVDFDCEFGSKSLTFLGKKYTQFILISRLLAVTKGHIRFISTNSDELFNKCRPRLNKKQVLDDWSWVPDGLVWADRDGYKHSSEQVRSNGVNSHSDGVYSCIGSEPDYREWANSHGVPVVEVSNGG